MPLGPRAPVALAAATLGLALGFGPGAAAAAAPAGAEPAAGAAAQLEVDGMTFVGTRGRDDEVVLRARRAVFHPRTQLADLEDVHAVARDAGGGRSFELTCDRAKLNLETNDFEALGNVHGVTHTGEHYAAPWVRYQRDGDLLFTDAAVRMQNEAGLFSGDGFRYFVAERRFKLTGNVEVVQAP